MPGFSKTFRHLLIYVAAPEGIMSVSTAYDFGIRTKIDNFDMTQPQIGDLIGSSFTIGTSALGSTALSFRQFRRPVPGHGRFAQFSLSASVARRITIGGFIVFAGLRRVI